MSHFLATNSPAFTVWHHGIKRLNCRVALYTSAGDSVPAHPGDNERATGDWEGYGGNCFAG